MLKRKEFILGAAVGLSFAAVATAGGVITWPGAHAEPARAEGRLTPSAGAAGLAFAPPQGAPLSFADIVQQVAPAVVQIEVETPVERPRGGVFQIPGMPGFGFQAPDSATPKGEEAEPQVSQGAGSGFFISKDGFIVTNNHVVANATSIKVKLTDGRELEATLVGRDEDTDLAVIKVEGSDFSFVTFEEEAEPRVGDWVVAVGNPFGLGGTATAGIVSARARSIPDEASGYVDFLQIDAAINRGNSGGPTFDIYGRVIGVNSAIISPNPTGGSVGIGFAIPASIAKPITARLISDGSVERGYLGVTIGTATDDQLGAAGIGESSGGALVNEVTADGPADKAGLQFGDVIVSMNGRPIATSTELTRRVGDVKPGETIRLDYFRDGRRQSVTIRSGTRPSREQQANLGQSNGGVPAIPRPGLPSTDTVAGLTVTPVTPALRQQIGIPDDINGLVITNVAPRTEGQFQQGFVIQRTDSVPIRSAADLNTAIAAARRAGRPSLLLLVWAGPANGNVPLVLELPKAE